MKQQIIATTPNTSLIKREMLKSASAFLLYLLLIVVYLSFFCNYIVTLLLLFVNNYLLLIINKNIYLFLFNLSIDKHLIVWYNDFSSTTLFASKTFWLRQRSKIRRCTFDAAPSRMACSTQYSGEGVYYWKKLKKFLKLAFAAQNSPQIIFHFQKSKIIFFLIHIPLHNIHKYFHVMQHHSIDKTAVSFF